MTRGPVNHAVSRWSLGSGIARSAKKPHERKQGGGGERMNPKITEEKKDPEIQDYPRWTPEMQRFLKDLEPFREIIRAQRN